MLSRQAIRKAIVAVKSGASGNEGKGASHQVTSLNPPMAQGTPTLSSSALLAPDLPAHSSSHQSVARWLTILRSRNGAFVRPGSIPGCTCEVTFRVRAGMSTCATQSLWRQSRSQIEPLQLTGTVPRLQINLDITYIWRPGCFNLPASHGAWQ